MMLAIAVSLLLAAAVPLPEEDGIEHCLICHGKGTITRLNPFDLKHLLMKHPDDAGRPLKSDDPAFRARLHVDPTEFLASAHGKLKCVECHKDVTLPSHRPGRAKVDCTACHADQAADVAASRHHGTLEHGCYACHGGYHTMLFRTEPASPVHPRSVVHTCGACHEEYLETYLETYHGTFHQFGNLDAARCMSCHENHRVLEAKDPESTVHASRLAETCGKCHAGAPQSFARFRAHLNPLEDASNPWLFVTAWLMRILLITVLSFFSLQALLLLIRSWSHRTKITDKRFELRFNAYHRLVHLLIILSFFGLCATGLPLSFSGQEWARGLLEHLGGLESARKMHRGFAFITLIYAILHVGYLVFGKLEGSLLPKARDFNDLKRQWLWFLGKGPRPRFGSFSYMEKFDYWAVFWGVITMGLSGLMLWFPLFFSSFLPGWIFNWAKIVHAEEAALAMAYIFAIHFFHAHLRPGKFPLDPVMFSGRTPAADPERQASSPAVDKASPSLAAAGYLFGMICLIAGWALLALLVAGWIYKG